MSSDSHYDAIVVGSGFGGSVTAYRLAEAGKRVLVLERGRPYPPGSFTRSPYRARESFWDPPRGPRGHVPLLVVPRASTRSCRAGLGGGSLIYANVFIRKDENWFVQEDIVRRRLRVLAGQPRGPRPALRPRRADDQPAAVSRSTTSRTRRRRRRSPSRRRPRPTAWSGSCPSWPSRSPTRAARRCPGEAIVEEIPNLHGRTRTTCQMCRRVRRRLQLRRQEHARLQLPDARQAPRRGDPHAGRRAPDRAARTAAATTSRYADLERAPRGPADRRADLRPPDPQRRHARHHEPAAAQPQRVPAALAQARHAASAATATC